MGLLGGLFGGSSNVRAAKQFAEQAKFVPYNLNAGNYNTRFNGSTGSVGMSPLLQALQQSLYGGGQGILGGLSGMLGSGGLTPEMLEAFGSYNDMMPGIGMGDIDPSLANVPTAIGGPLRGQFNSAASSMLGQLGSFDPNQLASNYTSDLRAASAREEGNYAQNIADSLYGKGLLGGSVGQEAMGQVARGLEEADIQRVIAGKQYAGQEQNRMASLAGAFNQAGMALGDQQFSQGFALNDTLFNRAMMADELAFSRGNVRAQQRFQNAMQMFGVGQENIRSQLGAGLGMIDAGKSFDDQAMNMLGLSSHMGAQRSSANAAAYKPVMDAKIARNNAIFGGLDSLLGGFMGGFGGMLGGMGGGISQQMAGFMPQLQQFQLDPSLIKMPAWSMG